MPPRSDNGVNHNPLFTGPAFLGGPALRLGDSHAILKLLASYSPLAGSIA